MREHDVRDVAGSRPQRVRAAPRIDDDARDHPRVDHDERFAVTHETHRRTDAQLVALPARIRRTRCGARSSSSLLAYEPIRTRAGRPREAYVVRWIPRASVRGFEKSDRGWRHRSPLALRPQRILRTRSEPVVARATSGGSQVQFGIPDRGKRLGFTGVRREALQLRRVSHGPHDVQLRHDLLAPHELEVQAPARTVVARSVAAPRVSRTLVV